MNDVINPQFKSPLTGLNVNLELWPDVNIEQALRNFKRKVENETLPDSSGAKRNKENLEALQDEWDRRNP